ncbi:MAG: hypothetical protein NVS4B9_17490 [Ktedonobacteraceae bacterium]
MALLRRSAILITIILFVLGSFLLVPVQAKAASRGTLLIFLPGFNTDSNTPFPFGSILSQLTKKYPDVRAFNYSYRGLNRTYIKADTVLQSLNDDVNALTSYLTSSSVQGRDVYLIGHSLGGVIAAKYASDFSGFPPESNARLAGVITLDSPINGVDQNAAGATCYDEWLNILIALSGGRQNTPILSELTTGNATVSSIQTAGNKVPVLSIGSKDDCFIPTTDTYITSGENAHVTRGGTGDATHGAVLNDANTIDIITHWRARDGGVSHSLRPTLTTDCGHLTTPWVALYQYANFRGRELCFEGTGMMNLIDFEFDNQVMSINIAANGTFFDDINGRGNSLGFHYGYEQADLGTFWDNRIESFVVTS